MSLNLNLQIGNRTSLPSTGGFNTGFSSNALQAFEAALNQTLGSSPQQANFIDNLLNNLLGANNGGFDPTNSGGFDPTNSGGFDPTTSTNQDPLSMLEQALGQTLGGSRQANRFIDNLLGDLLGGGGGANRVQPQSLGSDPLTILGQAGLLN